MMTLRIGRMISIVLLASGLPKDQFALLPVFADRPRRKTVSHWAKRAFSNRYTGADLRAIRAKGQHRECARRLARMGALAA